MTDATTAAHASRNGHGDLPPDAHPAGDGASPPGGLAGRLIRAVAGVVQSRIPAADLDERDPDYIRERLPGIWLLASLYFRGEVRGLGNVPEEARCCWSATTPAATSRPTPACSRSPSTRTSASSAPS